MFHNTKPVKVKKCIIVCILLILFVEVAYNTYSHVFRISTYVFDGGGCSGSSKNYKLYDSIGQSVAGGAGLSIDFNELAGFWYTVNESMSPCPQWSVTLTVEGMSVINRRSFGVNCYGTDVYDEGLDVILPPPGFTFISYFQGTYPATYLATDIRSSDSLSHSWILGMVNNDAYSSVNVAWDPADLPDTCSFILDGTIDMRAQNSATFCCGNPTLTIQMCGRECGIHLNVPQEGEILCAGDNVNVTWTSMNTSGILGIEYSTNGGISWQPVIESTFDDQTHPWTVPDAFSTDCLLRIFDSANPSCCDTSDTSFTICNTPQADFTYSAYGCSVTFIDQSSPPFCITSWNWDFGDGSSESARNPSYTYTFPEGEYDVTLTVTGLCGSHTTTKKINVCKPDSFGVLRATNVIGDLCDTVCVYVLLELSHDPIDAFGFELTYADSILDFMRAEEGDLTEGWMFFAATDTIPGIIRIAAADTEAIDEDSTGSIAKLFFTVTCADCNDGDQSQLCLQNLKDDLIDLNVYCGTFTFKICMPGDLNCDCEITPEDALCAFWCYLLGDCPSDCKVQGCKCCCDAGDVNCDGEVTPGDALCIFWRSILGYWQEECQCSTLTKATAEPKAVYEICLDSLSALPGDNVRVPIQVLNPAGIDAFGAELTFSSEMLVFVGVSKTDATADWTILEGKQIQNGVIKLGGFHTNAVSDTTSITLANAKFIVKDGAKGKSEFDLVNLTDDFEGVRVIKGILRIKELKPVPTAYSLTQNYPNPFNLNTTLKYQLPEECHVTLKIYNNLGQEIKTLIEKRQGPGIYTVQWGGRNEMGYEVSSGVYFYRLQAGDFVQAKRVLLLK